MREQRLQVEGEGLCHESIISWHNEHNATNEAVKFEGRDRGRRGFADVQHAYLITMKEREIRLVLAVRRSVSRSGSTSTSGD